MSNFGIELLRFLRVDPDRAMRKVEIVYDFSKPSLSVVHLEEVIFETEEGISMPPTTRLVSYNIEEEEL